jgi:hypothetical protein
MRVSSKPLPAGRESRLLDDPGCPSPYHRKEQTVYLEEETILAHAHESIWDYFALTGACEYDLNL